MRAAFMSLFISSHSPATEAAEGNGPLMAESLFVQAAANSARIIKTICTKRFTISLITSIVKHK